MFYILATHPVLVHPIENALCDFLITKARFEFTAFYRNFSAALRHAVGFHCALSSLSLADYCMPTTVDNSPSYF
jgi:hypothetical protein